MGFQRGETFGMLLPNIPEYPVTLLGASGIGMPVALINPSYTAGTNRLVVFLKREKCNGSSVLQRKLHSCVTNLKSKS
jgi:acyl-CoA synthetase (AMP-forming)/AMP-acid ligase II